MHPALLALLICAAGAVLEGALAGRDVRARFAKLRQPPFSPSLLVWLVIGGAYYIICYVILFRLLASELAAGHRAALALVMALMMANAAWNFVFFRRKDLRASFLAFLPYTLVAVALMLILAGIDRTSALVLTPYLLYLCYSVWWSYRVWVLNPV